MKNQQIIFIIVLSICSIIIINIIANTIIFKDGAAFGPFLGSIFSINSKKIKGYYAELLKLDKFHAILILRKGLPIVRVNNKILKKSEEFNPVINFVSKLLFDLPPSFFKSNNNVKTVINQNEFNNQIQDKMKAEGRHQGEKVELDFWQTKATTKKKNKNSNNSLDNILPRRQNEINDNRNKKIIGIYHTHTAENYENRGYNAHADPGERGDIIKVGRWIKQRLRKGYDISVIHSNTVHDKTYDRSYIRSLHTAKDMVDNNQELNMIFDIHRDAVGKGNKEIITTEINGQKVAKIMIVVTNNNYGLTHPNWRKNFAFAKKLAAKMNSMYPGLLREVELISNRRYNQHLHPHSLLLEFGGASNSLVEVERASYLFANVLAKLMEEEKLS